MIYKYYCFRMIFCIKLRNYVIWSKQYNTIYKKAFIFFGKHMYVYMYNMCFDNDMFGILIYVHFYLASVDEISLVQVEELCTSQSTFNVCIQFFGVLLGQHLHSSLHYNRKRNIEVLKVFWFINLWSLNYVKNDRIKTIRV